ncbi:hypothetical protein [Natronoglomus mannanivorans]|uniref:Uncharacterized protein n=1 Tax=Natronoglomus mannanivorans TaxID=2979990 RepID=A0AAP3E413_9EURY|nr:hypothetical protein [Halobacteria archaeon AArc-xg1-1]
MTANNTNADDRKNVASHENTDSDFQYHCPHCDKHYANEILIRVHITRSDDAAHANRDGFMPEAEICVTDTTGTELRSVTKRPRDINAQSVTLNDFPDDLTDRHKLILLAATHNPHETEYTELKNIADELFEQYGDEPLSYATVRRVTRRFYRPDTSDRVNTADTTQLAGTNDDSDAPNTRTERVNQNGTLADLTPKQQAIVIATVTHPDDSNVQIAGRINTAQSYPSQVTEKFNRIVNRIDDRIDSGDAIETVLADEIEHGDITTLTAKNLLDDVAINPHDILNEIADSTENGEQPGRKGTLDSFRTTDSADGEDSEDDTPFDCGVSEQNAVMTASPYDTKSAGDNTSSHRKSTETTTKTYTADQVMSQHTDGDDADSDRNDVVEHTDVSVDECAVGISDDRKQDMIPRSEIEQLKLHVEFERRLAERTANQSGNGTRSPDRIAFAKIMETELNAILEQ